MYFYGSGVDTDRLRGVLLLMDARASNSQCADFALRLIGPAELLRIAVGADLKNNIAAAIMILSPLAESENADAQYQLATIYERLGNHRKAILLYAKAAAHGIEAADDYLSYLGQCP
jgi:TPR repeat protein